MLWLTWRQHRGQVLVTAGFLVAVGVVLLVHGLTSTGLSDDALGERYNGMYAFLGWLPVVPLVAGMFWGAPVLARELERGTQRLAWTQSVSRRRWLAGKLGLLGLAVTVAGLLLGQAVGAWLTTYEGVGRADRFSDTAMFGATGVLGGAWWLFAFMLGAAAGGVLRRTLPALAVTIAVFVLAMVVVFDARPDYAQPVRTVLEHGGDMPTGFITGTAYLSSSGVEVDVPPECADEGRGTYLRCTAAAGYRDVLYYQPSDRYWRFQWTEAGLLALASALLAGPVVYRVTRRPV